MRSHAGTPETPFSAVVPCPISFPIPLCLLIEPTYKIPTSPFNEGQDGTPHMAQSAHSHELLFGVAFVALLLLCIFACVGTIAPLLLQARRSIRWCHHNGSYLEEIIRLSPSTAWLTSKRLFHSMTQTTLEGTYAHKQRRRHAFQGSK